MSRRDHRPTDRDLVAFADGSLPAARRAHVARAVAASPELQASVAAQRRALHALDDVAGAAPHTLRAQLALARDPRPSRRRRERALAALGAGALAVAGTAIVAGFAVGGGSAGGPTVADAAILATRSVLAPAPEPRHDGVTLPRLRAAGLPYPYWEDHFGFKARGVRRDRLDGRSATTVIYVRAGEQIAYTIISGPPLAVGSATRATAIDGTDVRSFSTRGRRIATWLRRGHTCVLSGTTVRSSALVRLAAWTSGGEIPY